MKKIITAIKLLFFFKNVDIEKVLVSNKISFSEKKTISTLLVTCIMIMKVKPIYTMLLNVRSYDGKAKWMIFLTEDVELLEKYNNIGIKSALI